MIRTIFVPLANGFASQSLLGAALLVAKRSHAHINAVYIRPDADTALAYMPDAIVAAGATRETIEHEGREEAAAEQVRFERWRHHNGIPSTGGPRLDSCFATWGDIAGEIEPTVARFGRVSDLTVLHRASPSSVNAQRCFDAAVFESGRPALVVSERLPFDITSHVVIAWNGSLQASRAVFGSMPLLRFADRVSIFAAAQPDSDPADADDLRTALSWHGIHAHSITSAAPNSATGKALVAASIEHEASLIVMGAYTHSRLRQTFLGGVTRHLLAHSPVPLLVSH
jgi:nucleotide-binding universal stress UspA family protein